MVHNDEYTSCDTSELDDKIFNDDAFCDDYDDTSKLFDSELYKFVNLDDYYHSSRSTSDTESKPRLSNFESFTKLFVSLECLISLILKTFMILRNHPLTDQIRLGV